MAFKEQKKAYPINLFMLNVVDWQLRYIFLFLALF